MTEQKINKSAFVDSNGKVFGSVGENIRNGSKSYESLKSSFDHLNENELKNLPMMPIKGHWEYITDTVISTNSAFEHHFSKYFISGTSISAELSRKIYLIIHVNCVNSEASGALCLPTILNNKTYILFISPAKEEYSNEYLIYVGDE